MNEPLRLLFVCSRNRWRSRTAEEVFRGTPGLEVRSAGTSPQARIRVNEGHLHWADLVFVMERRHGEILRERFPEALDFCALRWLDIPDDYVFMDEELVSLLKVRVGGHLRSE